MSTRRYKKHITSQSTGPEKAPFHSDFKNLVADLNNLSPNKRVSLILVKANICRLFEGRLSDEGFVVLNNGIVVPFPSTGQQNKFHYQIGKILRWKQKEV